MEHFRMWIGAGSNRDPSLCDEWEMINDCK